MNETFGQRLQRLRKNADLTQEEVATKLNITAQAVSKWENDFSAPDISVLTDLADIFNVSLDELLGREPSTAILPPEQRKNLDSMFLKVKVISSDGDKVNLNLPLVVVRAFTNNNLPISIGDKNTQNLLGSVDMQQILTLIEQGVVGKIVDIQSAEGDIVEMWVE